MLLTNMVDHGFECRLGQTKGYEIGFPAKHVALRSKSKYWLAQNQVNDSKWGNMSTCELLFL